MYYRITMTANTCYDVEADNEDEAVNVAFSYFEDNYELDVQVEEIKAEEYKGA